MGTSRRNSGLPQHYQISAGEYEPVEPPRLDANSPTPISLTWEERGGAGEPVTVATESISVIAWVSYSKISAHVDAQALAWARRAVYIEWQSTGMHRAWAWASAVDRL